MTESRSNREATGSLFYFGWIATVIVVLVTLGSLVLAREVWLRRQTSELTQATSMASSKAPCTPRFPAT
jgi:hypothetical protein